MFSFLYEILWDMPLDMMFDWGGRLDPLGTFMALLWWGLMGLVISMILYGIYYVIETAGIPERAERSTITGKQFTPAHTTMVTVNTGKSVSVIPVHHPDRWHMTFRVNKCKSLVSFDITQSQFNAMNKGDEVNIMIRRGRISGSKYGFGFQTFNKSDFT
ncbi:MAG: hypothetical protein VX730_06890 [Pseudomonadota bacterium]|nr:hypothetical protein [Pseudomonadota bacterium]